MPNTIAELFTGNIDPIRSLGLNNAELRRTEALMFRDFEQLSERIKTDQIELLQTCRDCVDEYVLLIAEQAFCDGFSLGETLIAEALTKN